MTGSNDVRRAQWLDDIFQDVRYAFRALRQLPGFAVIALAIMALGIGATTVMFTLINGVLINPLSYPEADKLLVLHGVTNASGEFSGFSNPDLADIRRENRSVTLAGWAYGGGTLSEPGEPEYVGGRKISSEMFAVLGVPLLQGRGFRPEEDRPGGERVAIISASLWLRRFGGRPDAIGRSIVFEGNPYIVIGVAPDVAFSADVDVFTPLGQSTDPRMLNRQARFIGVIGRLRPGVGLPEAQAELTLMARSLATQYPASNAGLALRARPMQQDLVGSVRSTLWLLFAAVSVVLLIACVNVASLLLARAVSRQREFATRIALGASRGRVVRQCLTESAVLGVAGGTLGLLLSAVAIGPFLAFWPDSLPRAADVRLDWHVALFALIVSLGSGLLFGLAPALQMPFGRRGSSSPAGARVTGNSRRLHGAFVVSEIALAVVLLVSAATLGRTLLALSFLDPGLNIHNVLAARFAVSPSALASPAQIQAAWRDALDRGGRVPGVESIALADIIPMREGENTVPYSTTSAPLPANDAPRALASTVTPGFLDVMGIPLRRGRFFDDHDTIAYEPVIVIDENLQQHAFGREDAVGKRLWIPGMGSAPLRIVGVVGHVRHWGLARDDQSRVRDQMYYPLAQVPAPLLHFFSSIMSIAVRTTVPPLAVVEPLRRELRGAAGDQAVYEVRTMEQLASASLARQRFLTLVFGIFGGVALLQACVGIYGVLAYLTRQRTPELGIRVALGATSRDVQRLVLRQGVPMIAVGVGVGGCCAWAAGRLLMRLVEGIRPVESTTLVGMVCLLVAAAFLASFVPARRASRVEAMQALRQN